MAPVPPPQEANVAVMVRVRPPTPSKRERVLRHPVLNVVNQHMLIFNPEVGSSSSSSSSNSSRRHVLPTRKPKSHNRGLQFVFDRVFGEEATQEEVFQHTTRGLLDSVLNGCNCSVFAYGATGAGKTYTMLGSEESPGIMYHTMVELYQKIRAEKPERSCEVLVSYLEVYNEQIHDLLMPKGPLPIREDPEKGVMVQGLSFHQPTTAKQLLEMVASGNKNRTQHPTDANASSSRSHAIFQVHVKQQDHSGDLAGQVQVAKMSLVDLAGSERASVTNTRGDRLREGANINRSLLALVNVITALADPKSKKTHVPYRDSKLTHLLKDSIGGNCRTIVVAAVSPSPLAYEDTYNTLKYAGRAKEIKQSLKNNMLTVDCHVCQCPMPCQQLRAEVAELREKLCAYKEAVETPPGSLGAAQLSSRKDLQLSSRKGRHLLRGWSGSQPERLLAALLSFAVKQHSLLQAADLLTPDVASEWEELERMVRQESGVSLEPATAPRRATEASRCPLAQRTWLGCDAEASVNVPSAPVLDAALQGLQQLSPIPSAKLLALSSIRRRRRLLETNSASQAGSPGCNLPAVPTSIMNVTFEICSSDISPGTAQPAATSQPEFSILKSIQNTLDKNKGSLVAKASSIPRSAVKGSSIPKPSSLSQAARRKWRGQESSPWPSKGGSQNLLPMLPHSSQRSSKPSRLPVHLSRRLAWKGCRRTPRTQPALSSRHLTSTPQLVKLLC